MVRLRVGRFAWDLNYSRTRAVLPRQETLKKMSFLMGHLGYVTGLCQYVMTDMIWLRSFAILGATTIVGFQLVQPKVQWLSAGWNSVYCLINFYQIHLLLRPPPKLSDEEASLLECIGEPLTARELRALTEIGDWYTFEEGVQLTDDGLQPGVEHTVHIVATGLCDVRVGRTHIGTLGPGSVVGEAFVNPVGGNTSCTVAPPLLPSTQPLLLQWEREWAQASVAPSATSSSLSGYVVTARSGVRCLSIPVENLENTMRRDPVLAGALQGLFARSLAAKVLSVAASAKAQQYDAILEALVGHKDACAVAASDAVHVADAVVAAVGRFRHQAGISDEQHDRMLSGLPQSPSRLAFAVGPTA